MKMKIVIIDDHHLFLHGMELMLQNSGANVVTFDSAITALTQLKNEQPDLILIDLAMPEMDGFSLLRALDARAMLFPVAVVSASEDIAQISDVLNAGAMGFIPKSYPPEKLLNAIEDISMGHIHVPEMLAVELARHKENEQARARCTLSSRQLDVLKLLAKGYPNKKVADILNISEDTVKFHLRGIYKALGVSNRTESVTRANELGLLPLHRA
ncbi:response regulator transcription factor [Motilimonas eburnea]|uniref:response regulator transcription factor n=1 Tax=Motilimonas eburnea TaxID=1737488 RepID=UPI001E5F949F|nr:response regulator transcription factor [Motilimonas eburnea]MCE2572768.1 response regulator transcription factor [Motilimonas eburnea]